MVDGASNSPASPLPQLLKEYQLCKHCLLRQGHCASDGKRISKETVKKCYICKGLFERLDEIVEKALVSTERYSQFDTFVVGATLPTQPYEREDAIRARLKIRGRESVKNHLTRELGARIANITHKKADYLEPDLTINVVIGKNGEVEETTARSKPLALLCRYIKRERGLPQKAEKCPLCLGKGCNLCDGTGLGGPDSIEGIMANYVVKITGGQTPKFSWMGSEDQSSLVLGRGRPFYVRVSNPKVRNPRKVRFVVAGVEGRMVQVLDDFPDTHARFTVKTRITCKCDRLISSADIRKLKKTLAGVQVQFENRSKIATKKIYTMNAKRTTSNEFMLTITADGGLPIKQFVGGEQYIEPSVSSLLKSSCQCITFDILRVDFLDSDKEPAYC